MEENKITQRLFDLLTSKSFDMLNSEERKSALTEVTEEEYRAMFELQRNVTGTMKEEILSPSISVREKLLSSYDKKYETRKQKSGRGSIFLMKVPLYQVAAAIFAAIIITGMAFYFGGTFVKAPPQVVYQLKRDTIFVNSKQEAREINTDSLAMNSPSTGHQDSSENTNSKKHAGSFQQHKTDKGDLSRSIKQDSGLKQFMVSSLMASSL